MEKENGGLLVVGKTSWEYFFKFFIGLLSNISCEVEKHLSHSSGTCP
jgi:hypothetical protein